MASIRKHGKGWRAEVYRKGQRRSKVCASKREAMAWALQAEEELGADRPNKPVRALLQRYLENVTQGKRSAKQETKRVERLQRDPLGDVLLHDLGPRHITDWRDRALQQVSPAAVNRDWNLLNHAFALAVREWQWLTVNPMQQVQRPRTTPPRKRRLSDTEVERLLAACGWPGSTIQARVGDCILFALETAMRAGEIVSLTWDRVHPKHVHLDRTKNGNARDVPLSTRAREILDRQDKSDPVFGITSAQLDALFRKARDRALLEDLHFHDTRREALTRMAAKVDVLTLARISGHRDLRILLSTYYQPDVEEIADRLE